MAKPSKKLGDPFETGDPVWVMNLGGKNRAGYYEKEGMSGSAYVRAGKTRTAGWWVSSDLLRHRYQNDGVQGEVGNDIEEAHAGRDMFDPLSI